MRTPRDRKTREETRDSVRAGLEALAARQRGDDTFPPPHSELATGRSDVLRDALRSLVMRRQARVAGNETAEPRHR